MRYRVDRLCVADREPRRERKHLRVRERVQVSVRVACVWAWLASERV